MLNFYLVQRTDDTSQAWDESIAFVVCEASEQKAREMAERNAECADGVFLNPDTATCILLTLDQAGIILESFNAGWLNYWSRSFSVCV